MRGKGNPGIQPAGRHKLTHISKWKSWLSLSLAAAVVFPHLAWAFESQVWQPIRQPGKFQNLQIPRSLGRVAEFVPGRQRLVILIKDLHCNYEVQMKIARLLEHVSRRCPQGLIGIEGASQAVDVSKLASFPDPDVRSEVGDYFLRQGRISGAEFYAANSGRPVQLLGMEDAGLYQTSWRQLRDFYGPASHGLAGDLRQRLESLQPALYAPEQIRLEAWKMSYRESRMSYWQYCRSVYACARRCRLPLGGYSQLQAYTAQTQCRLEDDLESEAVEEERQRLEDALHERFQPGPRAGELRQCLQRLEQIEDALYISASPRTIAQIRARREQYRAVHFLRFWSAAQKRTGECPDEDFARLDQYLDQALDFYATADQRSLAMADRLWTAMGVKQAPLAVLIAGGYHAREILSALRRRGTACMIFQPRLTDMDAPNPYSSLLRKPGVPLEKWLAREKAGLMLPSFFADGPRPNAGAGSNIAGTNLQARCLHLELILKTAYCLRWLGTGRLPRRLLAACLRQGRFPRLRNLRGPESLQIVSARGKDAAAYLADSRLADLGVEQARRIGRACLLPLQAGGRKMVAVLGPHHLLARLSSPLETVSLAAGDIALYPNPMRQGVEAALIRQAGTEAAAHWWSRLHAWIAGLSILPARDRGLPSPPGGKVKLLVVYKELAGDLKLAVGLWPALMHISPDPGSWIWTLGLSGALFLLLGVSTVGANFILAFLQGTALPTRQSAVQSFYQECREIKQGINKSLMDFKANRTAAPLTSMVAVLLLVVARTLDYSTQFVHLTSLHLLLPFGLLGLLIMAAGTMLLRVENKTEWVEDLIIKSLRIISAVLLVEICKFPFAWCLSAVLGRSLMAEKTSEVSMKMFKKIAGLLSFTELLLSLMEWYKQKRRHHYRTEPEAASGFLDPAKISLREGFRPGSPLRQICLFFGLSCLIFITTYLSLPLQVALGIQTAVTVSMLVQWYLLSQNHFISQKVKILTLASLLPASLVILSHSLALALLLADGLQGGGGISGLASAAAALQSLYARFHEITIFVLFIYSLLGFSNVLKDQSKANQMTEPNANRSQAINDRVQTCLALATKKLRGPEMVLLLGAFSPCQLRLVPKKATTDTLKEPLAQGFCSLSDHYYFRRRSFNLLSDETIAALLFREKLLQAGLSPDLVEPLVQDLTGKDCRRLHTICQEILKAGSARESQVAMAYELNTDAPTPDQRAAFQRQSLERRYKITFPADAPNSAFSGSWPVLNQIVRILLKEGIEPHPVFFLYPAEIVREAAHHVSAKLKLGQAASEAMYRQALQTVVLAGKSKNPAETAAADLDGEELIDEAVDAWQDRGFDHARNQDAPTARTSGPLRQLPWESWLARLWQERAWLAVVLAVLLDQPALACTAILSPEPPALGRSGPQPPANSGQGRAWPLPGNAGRPAWRPRLFNRFFPMAAGSGAETLIQGSRTLGPWTAARQRPAGLTAAAGNADGSWPAGTAAKGAGCRQAAVQDELPEDAAEHPGQTWQRIAGPTGLTDYQKTWQVFLIGFGQHVRADLAAGDSVWSGFSTAVTTQLQATLDSIAGRLLPELQVPLDESAADRDPEAAKLLQQHGFPDFGSVQSWSRRSGTPLCPLLLRPLAAGAARDRAAGLAGYYAERGALELPTLYVPRLALRLLLRAKPAGPKISAQPLRFFLWTLGRGYIGLLLKIHSAAYFRADGRGAHEETAAFHPMLAPAAPAPEPYHPEDNGLQAWPACPGSSVPEAYARPPADTTVSAYDLMRLLESLLAAAGQETQPDSKGDLSPAWKALRVWQAQGAEPGIESWLMALKQSPEMLADRRSKWVLVLIEDSLTLPASLGQALRQDAAAYLISNPGPGPGMRLGAENPAGEKLPPKIRLVHLPKTFAGWRSDVETALRQIATAGTWKQQAGLAALLMAVDQALTSAAYLPAGESLVLIPELAAKLWPAIAGLAAGEKPSACDFGADLENHKIGFTTGTLAWADHQGWALPVRQVGERVYTGTKQAQVTYYDGRMTPMVRLEGWRKTAVHLWLMGIEMLPIRLEQGVRKFWLQQSPGGYLQALLNQDPSLLAKILLQEQSPLAQSYYRWILNPGPGSAAGFLRSLVRTLCRQGDEDLRGSLLTLQRLSNALPGLEPVELRLASRPLSAGLPAALCLPGGLLQPGLDGPLRCLLRRCQEAEIKIEGASLEGQRRRHFFSSLMRVQIKNSSDRVARSGG